MKKYEFTDIEFEDWHVSMRAYSRRNNGFNIELIKFTRTLILLNLYDADALHSLEYSIEHKIEY